MHCRARAIVLRQGRVACGPMGPSVHRSRGSSAAGCTRRAGQACGTDRPVAPAVQRVPRAKRTSRARGANRSDGACSSDRAGGPAGPVSRSGPSGQSSPAGPWRRALRSLRSAAPSSALGTLRARLALRNVPADANPATPAAPPGHGTPVAPVAPARPSGRLRLAGLSGPQVRSRRPDGCTRCAAAGSRPRTPSGPCWPTAPNVSCEGGFDVGPRIGHAHAGSHPRAAIRREPGR